MHLLDAVMSLFRTHSPRNHPPATIAVGSRIDEAADESTKANLRLAAAMKEIKGVRSLVDLLGKH